MPGSESGAPALHLRAVRKSYGDHEVLRGVDLDVARGQVLGLLGRNGAGKSTLIEIMCGLRSADSGSVSVCGADPAKERVGQHIGYAPQDLGVYPDLTVAQNLSFYGQLQGLSRKRARTRTVEVMELLGLEEQCSKRAKHLSGGQRRRLHAGMAIMHEPEVVFMDEPTVGADVEARSRILRAVRSLAEAGAAVVYTSHYLAEFEELGADIAILEGGRVVVSGTLERVVADHSRASIALGFSRNPRPMDGWRNEDRWLRREGDIPNPGALIADALASPALRGNRLEDVRIGQAGLQSAYLAIVGEEEQDNA